MSAATQRDWLLLLLGLEGGRALDPVRIQKGMFLLAKEGGIPEAEQYIFRPYDYGPFSSRIYSDLDALVEEGVVEREAVPGYTWSRFRLTPNGAAAAQQVLDAVAVDRTASVRFLMQVKRDILSQSFSRLLRYVYDRYPEYAKNSIFSG